MSGLLYYSTSDGDGRGRSAAGTDVINSIDLTVWAPASVISTSPNGTTVTSVGPTLVDAAGVKWSLTGTARNFVIAVNGTTDTTKSNVTGLLFQNNRVYCQTCVGSNGGNVYDWYYKASAADTWHGPFSDPRTVWPTTFIDITASPYNAKGDGITDNTTAIQNAFNAAVTNKVAVFIPGTNFAHSGLLTINGIHVFGTGNSSILTATNPAASAIQIIGSGAILSDVTVNCNSTGRLTTMQAAGIWPNGCTNYTITRVVVNAAACAGIYSVNASNGTIQYNTVSNTLADAITQTFGSNHITVDSNCAYKAGDDGYSNNTYVGDVTPVNNITISNNTDLLNTGGRCMEVSGGNTINFTGNYVEQGPGNPFAGLFLATEISSFQTQAVAAISVTNNTFVNVGGQHGAIILWGENTNYSITGVTVNGNQIVTPLSNPVQVVGDATIQALIENITVYSNAGFPFYNNTGTHATITGGGDTTVAASNFTTPVGYMYGGCGAGTILGATSIPQPPNSIRTKVWLNPGQDGRYWKLPQQTTAIVDTTSSNAKILRNGISGNTPIGSVNVAGNWSPPFYYGGKSTDPVVTIINSGDPTITVHIPLGGGFEEPGDFGIGGTDATKPGLTWNCGVQSMTANGVNVTTVQASGTVIHTSNLQLDWGFGPIMEDAVTGQPGGGNGFGIIQDIELTQALADPKYVIPHMLQIQLDDSQVNGNIVWPLLIADGSQTFTGPLTQGYTVLIPASTPRPSGMTRGQALWFDTFQQMGALVYNFGATGGGPNIQVYSTLSANSALVADLVANWRWVIQFWGILTNQTGPNSAKGMINGVRSDAFPAPPLLDLSDTGGIEVSSTTVGAYYPTNTAGYSVASGGYTAPTPS